MTPVKRIRWIDLQCTKCGQRVRLPRSQVTLVEPEPAFGATVLLDNEPARCPGDHGGNTYWLGVFKP